MCANAGAQLEMPKWKTKQSMSPKEEKSLQVVARSELKKFASKTPPIDSCLKGIFSSKNDLGCWFKKKIRKTRIAVNAI